MLKIIKNFKRFSTIRDKIKAERQTRLGKTTLQTVLPTKSIQQIQKIRNIGIIAHIDAGKTTTTQRMLYYAGALPSPGDIDEGTTTMDYMKQQRQRGITIRSAAISFNWKKYQINLIDTPGHVDFSGEVARSLKVLDGAITILDGVKGVQAQTVKVWQQAKRRNIPRICYLNKMDRIGASVLQSAQSIQKRLKVQPLIMQYPIGQADLFKGVIDLANMQQIHFIGKYGQTLQKHKITKDHPKYKQLLQQRLKIIQQIGNYHEQIGQLYLNQKQISGVKIKSALRKLMSTQNQHNLCPIFIGTSFKNRGVQPLMDAVIELLPSPNQRQPICDVQDKQDIRKPTKSDPLVGYVFKILYDLELGPLAYTRIYSGQMKKSMQLLNTSTNVGQKIGHIYRVRANQYVPINQIAAGDIVAISGFKQTKAGQTLIEYGSKKFCLDPLQLPSAVFTVPFEVQSNKYLNAFKQAIEKATIQDDSLHYQYQQQTGQYLLTGLGELHLQILRDKLIEDKIPVRMGNLKINYKQTVGSSMRDKLKIRKQVKPGVFEQFQIDIEIVPLRNSEDQIEKKNSIVFTFDRIKEFDQNWREFLRRKIFLSQTKKASLQGEDQTQENFVKISKKSVRNPTPVQPMQQQLEDQGGQYDQMNDDEQEDDNVSSSQSATMKDQQSAQPLYHISTLPFQTLYELYQTCRISLMYGKRSFPMTGVQIRIHNGIYTKNTFTKNILNRTTTQLLRKLINSTSTLLEPMMEFTLTGEQTMIQYALKDVLNKRGTIQEQQMNAITGKIPASQVRGWIKQLRAMGLEVQMKFCDYQEVTGIDPGRLLQNN